MLENVVPGRYRIRTLDSPPNAYLESILVGEQDVLTNDVELSDISPPVRLLYRRDPGTVRGTVENGPGATVVLIPQEKLLLGDNFTRIATCDSTGRFEVTGLRPGDYYAFAFRRELFWNEFSNPAFFTSLIPSAVPVQVRRGEASSANLRVTTWPE